MKTKIFSLIIFLALAVAGPSDGSDWLRIQDPQRPWRAGTGTIEQAVVSIQPQGLYMEIGLYLTFSARSLGFVSSDSLEVQFHFDLPQDAIVHDLWLWVGEDIMRAKITDRWTASAIYEDIVRRRRDPAILFKRGPHRYELRIYPMEGDESRRIKLTYMVPAQWSPAAVFAALPANLIRTSKSLPSDLSLLYWPRDGWSNPKVVELPDLVFQTFEDPERGQYLFADAPLAALDTHLNFELTSPLKEGIYLSRFDNGSEGFYQLVLLPSEALALNSDKKVAILIDHDASKSTFSAVDLLNATRFLLDNHFTASDSFNLIFSGLDIRRAAENWIAADPSSIEQTFDGLGANPIKDYSTLPSLLCDGIEFVQALGNNATLLLISSSDQLGDYRVANSLLESLSENYEELPPIYVADFNNINFRYYRNGARDYRGNEYFFENITRQTNAAFVRIDGNESLTTLLARAFQTISGFIEAFDFHTTLTGGFCYGRFDLNTSGLLPFLDKPILQVGKYVGEFPFVVEVSGIYNREVFNETLEIPADFVQPADTLVEEIWVGQEIAELESQPESNDLVSRIVDISVRERVLSQYTAFLALEPSDSVIACGDCYDETQLIPTSVAERDEQVPADSILQAFPNPFNAHTTISLRLPRRMLAAERMSLQIFNLMGQLVKSFDDVDGANQSSQLVWDGRNERGVTVGSGSYFAVLRTPSEVHSLKLVMLK